MASKPVKITAPKIRSMKERERIVCLTAYDISSAVIADDAGVDLVLVGDSMGNVIMGLDTTLPVTLDNIAHHLSAVSRAISRPLIVADMPFGSYGSSVGQAVDTAVALVRAGAEAVKLEGAFVDEIHAISKIGIPVMGHVGMTPQSVHNFGGFKVQGRGSDSEHVLETAKAVDEAGVFSMVLELIPAELARQITSAVACPTIGIGAGLHCDGEVQVFHDILGLGSFVPKHTKTYVEGRQLLTDAVRRFADEVRNCKFPGAEQSS